jgi:meso-butanediol dehydrogenase / (S,S)-butanediol dehydrogenase / diacetyl reductase
MQRFEGKVALVTGAASGIGKATVERLLAEGASIVAVDVQPSVEDDRVVGVVGSVADPAAADEAVRTAVDRFGGLHVVANVAGILRTANAHEHSLEMWQQVLDVNLTGTFLVCKAAIPVLLEGGGGAIVNTASTAALAGQAWGAAYSASKGGVLAFTRVLAVEYAKRGIRANTVSPGSIETPITESFEFPPGADTRLVHRSMAISGPAGPEVIAAAIAYLGSDDALHVNGADLRVDGGTLS